MSGMESIDYFYDICDQLRSCSSIEEVETLKRNLEHPICDKDISTRKRKLKEVIGYSEEGGAEEIPDKNRIPSVDELTKQVDGLIGEVKELAALGPAPPLQKGSMNNENEYDFESRRSIFTEIMEAIKDDGVGMIGIWGMPGIGKTTLVKRVAKYARDEGLFEEVAMAVVSQNPSFKSIQGQIADMIGLTFTRESVQGRAGQLLQTLLATKKILIILDDVWDSIELNDIGIPSGSQHKGCKIISTSRILDVCEQMRTQKNFKIDLLSANEALLLFLQMSGVDDQSSEKGRLAKNLSEECGRLPISVAIIARGLFNKKQPYWTDMLNRLRKLDPDRKVYATIKLSYDNLFNKEEKMFFLLCAMFPEDYKIPIRLLFQYGLGLNLFDRVDNVHEAEVRAYKLASSLKSSSLLLDEGDENFVKMHDVIRDVALVIASEGKHAFLVPGKMTTSSWSDDVKKLPDVSQLRILMLDCRYPDFQFHDNFFARMKNLIVLDMSFYMFERFPQSFAALENLRTLRVKYSSTLRDISVIGKLQNLICLSLGGLEIKILPKEVGELSNLRLLNLSTCHNLEIITPGVIQNLSQLEVLRLGSNVRWCDRKEVCHSDNASLLELIHLSHLIILDICIPDASMLPDKVRFENLMKFKVSIGQDDWRYLRVIPNDGSNWHKVLLSNSKILKLTRISKNDLLKAGIKMLMKKVQHLELKGISGISVALPFHLWQFDAKSMALANLKVESCEKLEYVFEEQVVIPALETLYIYKLERLKKIWHIHTPVQSFSRLKILKLTQCRELLVVFPPQATPSLQNLEEICIENCHKLETLIQLEDVALTVGDEIILFPRLMTLKLVNLPKFTAISSTISQNISQVTVIIPALEGLYIHKLERLKSIWHIHTQVQSFSRLKILKLTECTKLLVVFPPQATSSLQNLEEICIENCHKLETLIQLDDVALTVGDKMILFPRLLTLKLVNLPKFTTILSAISQNISQATVILSATEIVTPCRLHNLESIMDQQLLNFFPKLKKLELESIGRLSSTAGPLDIIKGLEALEELMIKYINGKSLPQVIATLPKLRKLQFGFIHEPIELCESLNRCGWFQSLTSLNLFSCNDVKSLLRPSAFNCLVQLQELFVSQCETMESIVGETSKEQNSDKAIEFSTLHTLKLYNLPRLTSFYNGECALKLPCLGDLFIKDCPKLKTFASMSRETPEPSCQNFVYEEALFGQQVSFGRLKNLVLEQLESIEEIWHRGHSATTVGEIISLRVHDCDRLLKTFSSNLLAGLQNLKNLYVGSCSSLEHVFPEEDHPPPLLSNLQELELFDMPELKQLWWNKNSCESFGLPRLESLSIDTCPTLQFIFDPSVANRLENLNALFVENCSSIVEIYAEKPGKKIEFPLLDTVSLENLPCLKGNQFVEFQRAEPQYWVTGSP